MDRLFLDANVLFSAAYRDAAGVARLWELGNRSLVTSDFAAEEARRNLPDADQRTRLARLLEGIDLVSAATIDPSARGAIELPEKDWPILSGAVAAKATHLITGDARHFGKYFGKEVMGVLIVPPSAYLRSSS